MSPTNSEKDISTPPVDSPRNFGVRFVSIYILVAAVLTGGYLQRDIMSASLDHLNPLAYISTTTSSDIKYNTLSDKYDTDMVNIQVRRLVSDLECEADFTPEVLSKDGFIHVKDAMASPPKDDSSVFFMLNGRNEGVYVSWNGDFDCIGLSSKLAAKWLGADQDVMANGVRLYSQMGHPIRSAEDLVSSKRLVHILLDFQLWQWPGIEKGYKYHLEDGVVMTTVGMRPKVFDVEYFFNEQDVDKIMADGLPKLTQSLIASKKGSILSKARTSHTAFLNDSDFNREMKKRATSLARLPSPGYMGNLQLVKYDKGEFYRKHLDTFHSRDILPEDFNKPTYEDYENWAEWASSKLRTLDQNLISERFQEAGDLHPDTNSTVSFPNALLDVFHSHATKINYFAMFGDQKWGNWIQTNVNNGAAGVLRKLLRSDHKPHYLPEIVKAWEAELNLPELVYTWPKKRPHGVSYYYQWIQWSKERIQFLKDRVPAVAQPSGKLYPKYTVRFQNDLLELMMEDFSKEFLVRTMNEQWYDWVIENRGRMHVLLQVMKAFPHVAELAIRVWESRVGMNELRYKLPKYVKHFHPQRYVTLFLYLNNETKVGGETVFPYSLDRFSDDKIERKGMDECSSGLAVPPRGLHASLFYVQTPEGDIDYLSKHGGCPPHYGTKWGSNVFMWNADADEGYDTHSVKKKEE